MIAADLSTKVRSIHIRTRKSVNSLLAGCYLSVFKGRGIEFDEVREYAPGDEVRDIDWNVTARSGRLYVKRYIEERQLTVLFVVDISRSASFGTGSRTKREIAAELCALLAFSAIKNNDKAGLLLFSDAVELFVPPRKGTSNAMRMIRDLLTFEPRRAGTNIGLALDFVGRVMHRRCVVFLVSDFLSGGFEHALRLVAKHHDLIAVHIFDARERSLPECGLVELRDAETGRSVIVDTGDREVRSAYERLARGRVETLGRALAAAGVDLIGAGPETDLAAALADFFRRRSRRVY